MLEYSAVFFVVFASLVGLFSVGLPVLLSKTRPEADAHDAWQRALAERPRRPAHEDERVTTAGRHASYAVLMFAGMLPFSVCITVGAYGLDASLSILASPFLALVGAFLGRRIVRVPQASRGPDRIVNPKVFE